MARKTQPPRKKLPYQEGFLCKTCRHLRQDERTAVCHRAKLEIENLNCRAKVCGCWNWEDKNAQTMFQNIIFDD